MKLLNRTLAALALSALVATVAACGGSNSAPTTANGLTQIRVGVVPNATAVPVYLAQSQGYFAKHGLQVDIQKVAGGSEELSRILSGDLAVGHNALVPAIIAASKKLPIRIAQVGDMAPSSPDAPSIFGLVVNADSPVKDYSDLKGQNIAVNALGAAAELTVRKLLDQATGDPKSAQLLEVPYPSMLAALNANRVAAAQLTEPFLSQAKAKGDRVISYPYVQATPGAEISCYVTGPRADPKVVAEFAAAIEEARKTAAADPALVRSTIGSFTEIKGGALTTMTLPDFSQPRSSQADQGVADDLKKYGFMDSAVKVDDLFVAKR